MPPWFFIAAVSLGALLVTFFGVLTLFASFYRKVEQGKALIISTLSRQPMVTFTGALVLPVFHKAETMDISVKTIEVDRRGAEGLICKDNIRADIKVTFFVRVNEKAEDVMRVAKSIGTARASDKRTIEELFSAKFSEALKTVGKKLDFEDLYKERESFRDQIIALIGKDLNGFVLEDAAIDYLEQTPLTHLDPQNILDAQGIQKIVKLTSEQNVLTNELRSTERKAIGKQNLETQEAVLEFARREADANAKQQREIQTMLSREQAETAKVGSEERRKAELARIESEEKIQIAEENRKRQVEVVEWGRKRVVAVEAERVEKEKNLEVIAREREVELARIEKEKALEIERKAIADVVRGRIVVDKTVAEEEERIKDLRAHSEATRAKDVARIGAEATAQEAVVRTLKAAEVAEEAAKFAARKQILEADAALESGEKNARAKIRAADALKAEVAAKGLAEASVREAAALATEKEGLAQARIYLEQANAEAAGEERKGLTRLKLQEAEAATIERRGQAEASAHREKINALAQGEEQQGLAKARVAEADAAALERRGLAEASTLERRKLAEAIGEREHLLALAQGEEQQGLAKAKSAEALAAAMEKQAQAEATGIRERLVAEATGLGKKAEAMKALEDAGREHEEFRLKLDAQKAIDLARVDVQKAVAAAHAEVVGKALGNAKIQVVGGDGAFFDRFVNAVSVAHTLDGFVENSGTARTVLGRYLEGDGDLPADLKEILTRPAYGTNELQGLSLAAVLARLAADAPSELRGKLNALVEEAKKLGKSG